MSVIYLTNHGRIIVCGSNEYGQLGLGVDIKLISIPQALSLDFLQADEKVCQITAIYPYGYSHHSCYLCLTNFGQLYGWGSNLYGSLVFDNKDSNINTPTLLPVINNHTNKFRSQLFTAPFSEPEPNISRENISVTGLQAHAGQDAKSSSSPQSVSRR